jgi:HAD superfamily hydrolase (TIGR01509 family)
MPLAELEFDRLDTVLLDMDGTLLDLHFDNYFWLTLVPEHYARVHGMDPDVARERVGALYRCHAGTLAWYCLDHWNQALEMDLVALKRAHLHRVAFLPGAADFLRALRARCLQAVIATNAHDVTLQLKLSVTGLAGLVDDVHSSHTYGLPKEDPQFWRLFQAELAFDPERTLFIDDNPSVLAAARDHGIAHLLAVRRPDSTRAPNRVAGFYGIDGVEELIPHLAGER